MTTDASFPLSPNDAGLAPRAKTTRTSPFLWSVRRELWENRSIYLAPLIVAAVQVLGFAITLVGLAERRRAVLRLPLLDQRTRIQLVYDEAATMMIFTVFIVGVFYTLDALYGERRDRTILFWKSLPVSDVTAVLAKMTIPLAVLPVIAFALVVCTQMIMLVLTNVTLLVHGLPLTSWSQLPLPRDWLVLLYGLVAIALWHVPIYGWLLLVSGVTRRAPFLWAVLPIIAGIIFERVTFGTMYFGHIIRGRISGFASTAFRFELGHSMAIRSLLQLTPGRYLASPDLWLGLLVGATFIVAAIRLRRYRGPI